MRYIALSAAVILSATLSSAQAGERSWTLLHRIDAQSGIVDVYADAGTVSRKGDRVQVWFLSDLKHNSGRLQSFAGLGEFDCKKKKYRSLHSDAYMQSPMATGEPTHSFDRPNSKFESFTLGKTAPAGIVFSFACR